MTILDKNNVEVEPGFLVKTNLGYTARVKSIHPYSGGKHALLVLWEYKDKDGQALYGSHLWADQVEVIPENN